MSKTILKTVNHSCHDVTAYFLIKGDNMLTALSVARESGFVKPSEPIILVQAFPPQTDAFGNVTETPHVEYVYTDAREDVEDNFYSMVITFYLLGTFYQITWLGL
ncbi:hypothetical protein DPMN_105932 [Dreissena polymorpha]|uniref:Uncharacterized protein n=1 Tax=Dreissena polymorpha TaxID=45954 RepID=A0A9D4K437_DREPO|nr:hypothetical protein DPMN_105932 [Dreissena polymorpha]